RIFFFATTGSCLRQGGFGEAEIPRRNSFNCARSSRKVNITPMGSKARESVSDRCPGQMSRPREGAMTMRSSGLAVALLGAALALTSAGVRADDGVTNDTVVIGSYGPITGPAAFIGLGGRDGAELAVEEINASGGVHGRKLKFIFE